MIISEQDAIRLVATITKHQIPNDTILTNLKTELQKGEILEQNELGGIQFTYAGLNSKGVNR